MKVRGFVYLGLSVLVLAVASCGDGDTAAPPNPRVVTTADPAATFAPLVVFSRAETRWPLNADAFVDYSSLHWASGNCTDVTLAIGGPRLDLGKDHPRPAIVPARLGGARPYRQRLFAKDCRRRQGRLYSSAQRSRPYAPARPPGLRGGDGFSLDLLTDWLHSERSVVRRGGERWVDGVSVYTSRRPETVGKRPGFRLTYWFLYGSEGTGPDGGGETRHEGDWERVSVLVRNGRRKNVYVPTTVRYHRAGSVRDVPWRSVELAPGGGSGAPTHPIAYSAPGDHAPHPSGEGLDGIDGDCAADCPRWATWRRLSPLRAEPWYGYGGGWGSASEGASTSGPSGPMPSGG